MSAINIVLNRLIPHGVESTALVIAALPLAFGSTVVGSAVLFVLVVRPVSIPTAPAIFPADQRASAPTGI